MTADKHSDQTYLLAQLVERLHAKLCAQRGVEELFWLEDRPLTVEALSSPDDILPALLWHAESLHDFACNGGMGIQYIENKEAATGIVANADKATTSTAEVCLYTVDAFFDALDNSPMIPHAGKTLADVSPLVARFMSAMAPGASLYNGQHARGPQVA